MERNAVHSVPLDFIKWQPLKQRLPILAPTLSNSLAIWERVWSNPNFISPYHPLAHFFNNPTFPLDQDLEAFQWWLNKGLSRIDDFLTPRSPFTLQHCCSKLKMPALETFRFYQILHFLRFLEPRVIRNLKMSPCKRWYMQDMSQRGWISTIHRLLLDITDYLPYVRVWDSDLASEKEPDHWHTCSP